MAVAHDTLSIGLCTNRLHLVNVIKETLSHIYPGVTIEVIRKDPKEAIPKKDILMIDVASIGSNRLEPWFEEAPDIPILVIVPKLADARPLRKFLQSRREIITQDDLSGMAIIHTVHHLMERQKLHDQLKRTSHKIKEMAVRDELTHLFNHRHFNDLLVQEVKKANRYRRPLAIVMVAIKNLKAINDTLGTHEGDRLLVSAAASLGETVREVDMTARYGDNEFAVILPESDEVAATRAAERIQTALRSLSSKFGEGKLDVLVCCGIAALGESLQTKEDLLRTALCTLMEAKKNGAGTICAPGDLALRRRGLSENRPLIERLRDRLTSIGLEAERSYFQAVMKTVSEFPLQRKLLVPHSERVAFFAERLGQKMGLVNGHGHVVRRAGLLHDTGKLAIDIELLTKREALTPAEFELMRHHPQIAVEMLSEAPFLSEEIEAIRHHHERYDGTGYPDGLMGDQIPLISRILSITEAWDTMVSPQPYRQQPLPLDAALSQLKLGAGSQFDPQLVGHFSELIAG